MKKNYFAVFILLLINMNTYSQSHESGVGINTSYSFFSGSASQSSSFVLSEKYTNSPLGKQFVLSYGITLDYKYIFRNNIILGAALSYEDLRTKVKINQYYDFIEPFNTNGRTILHNHFLNANPFVGYRFDLETVTLDVLAGFDVAYSLDCEEKAQYKKADGDKVKFTKSRKDSYIDFDIRPRAQVNLNYKNYTIFTAASFGMIDYYKDMIGGNDVAYLNTVRLGVLYRFHKTIKHKRNNAISFYL